MDPTLIVETHMPGTSRLALRNFTRVNPHWRGAQWSDVLDTLQDSDSNLEVTEPEYEYQEGKLDERSLSLVTLMTLTLYWAYPHLKINHGEIAYLCDRLVKYME